MQKLAKPFEFHKVSNTWTLEDVHSSLEVLKKLYGEDYQEIEQIRFVTLMLQGKAKVH